MNERTAHFRLDPAVTFLNHGSFGACPRRVLEQQARLRDRLESEPVQFMVHELPLLLDAAREALAVFLRADPMDLVFVPNATAGVNAVLRSLRFEPGDELVVTDHEYNACRNALDFVAERSHASVVVVPLPFPIESARLATEAIARAVGPRTRLLLIDHVTSPTALVLPVTDIVRIATDCGVDVLIDGAHAPGMLDLDLQALGAAYYTGNCHKWLCAPKGAAFLHVRRDRQELVHPISVSHGKNSPRTDVSRFRLEFDWTGTDDPTATLCVPEAIGTMEALMPGGWNDVRAHNRSLALQARRILCGALGTEPPCPDEMIGSMATVLLPGNAGPAPDPTAAAEPLERMLYDQHRIEVPVIPWARRTRVMVRISAQVYNDASDYRMLAQVLDTLLHG